MFLSFACAEMASISHRFMMVLDCCFLLARFLSSKTYRNVQLSFVRRLMLMTLTDIVFANVRSYFSQKFKLLMGEVVFPSKPKTTATWTTCGNKKVFHTKEKFSLFDQNNGYDG